MVRELRALGFVVHAPDLYAYADSLVPDMKTGVDVFDLKSLAGYRFIVTNLPYREQAARIVSIASRSAPSSARFTAHLLFKMRNSSNRTRPPVRKVCGSAPVSNNAQRDSWRGDATTPTAGRGPARYAR